MTAIPQYIADQFLPASFSGVEFRVRSNTLEGGLRGPDFEYPQRDTGATGNLGRKLGKYTFDAFVIGADHHIQAAALRAALNAGHGELIHPRYGAVQAICRSWSAVETFTEQGETKFSLSFTERGEDTGLTALVFPAQAVATAAADLRGAALNAVIDTIRLTAFPSLVGSANLALSQGVARAIAAVQSPLAGEISDFGALLVLSTKDLDAELTDGDALFSASMGQRMIDIVALLDDIGALTALANARPLPPDPDAAALVVPTEQQRRLNEQAIETVLQRAALASLATLAAAADYATFDAATKASDDIAALYETEELSVVTLAEFEALTAARVELTIALAEKADSLTRLRDFIVTHTTTALQMAWDLYGDADRADEISDRNGIAHPLFVPPGTYVVLAE